MRGEYMFSLIKSQPLIFKKALSSEDNWHVPLWKKLFTSLKSNVKKEQGSVVFVGAGTGDPELLTVKAVKALKKADVVLVDWLVNPQINDLISPYAERVFVGKKCGQHSMKQSEISKLLLDKAKENKLVVRLKGGDPSIFARLPEETEILSKHGISFQIIPGITAASGCAAYTGIPLTHRDCSQSVKFVTAHTQKSGTECDWAHLAKDKGTLVFYMGLNKIDNIAVKLIKYGMDETTPLAIVDEGTSENQQLITGQLSCFAKKTVELSKLKGPALIIVGKVITKRVDVDKFLLQHCINKIAVGANA